MITISKLLRNKNANCALIPFITAGYPDVDSTVDALHTLDKKGADIIELGIPYSDALADGPIIQESSRVALKQGVHIEQVLNILKIVSFKISTPIIIFTYYNPILVKGIKSFIKSISICGAKGLIIPDLPLEEADYVISVCAKFSIELILFISPTSSNIRIDAILSKSQECIYLVSSKGVTGLRNQISPEIELLAKSIKSRTNKLVMLGFGISNLEQARIISRWNVDGIVMGSAFMNIMSNTCSSKAVEVLGDFCQSIKATISNY